MPKLGGVILNVVKAEDRSKNVTATDRPIENGLNITDHVKKEPIRLKLSGVCSGKDASKRLIKLEQYADKGTQLTYAGRYYMKNCIIENIDTSKDSGTGGTSYNFDISLKQMMIVTTKVYKQKKAKPKQSAGKKQPTKKNNSKRTYTVKRGDLLSTIAQNYYGHSTSKYYMLIYNANKKTIGNDPGKIQVGMKLIIP